jgi:hypothetical protein
MLLEQLANSCRANSKLSVFCNNFRLHKPAIASATRRKLASVPDDSLDQAQRAMEALGAMQQQQQFTTGPAATGTSQGSC